MENNSGGSVSWAVTTLSIVGSLASIIGLIVLITDRYTGLPEIPRLTRLSVIVQLGVYSGIIHAALWALTERGFRWSFGAGGSGIFPEGWSAIGLSLTVTVPLAVVPPVFQAFSGQSVILPQHWTATLALLPLGALAHLLMYGFGSKSFQGFSRMIAAPAGPTTLNAGINRELVYAGVYFLLIVLPYRLIVRSPSSAIILDELLGRTVVPALVFVLGMTVFILLRYPASLNEMSWVQVRGVLSGIVLLCGLCAGMFV